TATSVRMISMRTVWPARPGRGVLASGCACERPDHPAPAGDSRGESAVAGGVLRVGGVAVAPVRVRQRHLAEPWLRVAVAAVRAVPGISVLPDAQAAGAARRRGARGARGAASPATSPAAAGS